MTIMCGALRPAKFRSMVKNAIEAKADPDGGALRSDWDDAYKDLAVCKEVIKHTAGFIDRLALSGFPIVSWTEGDESDDSDRAGKKSRSRSNRKKKTKAEKKQELCRNFLKGKCNKGSACEYKHDTAPATGTQPAGSNKPTGKRCKFDKKGEKCPHGKDCHFAHLDASVNTPKSSKNASKDNTGKTCNACGGRGHLAHACNKVAKHEDELKKLIGYTGDRKWFADKANAKASKALFKSKQWQATAKSAASPTSSVLPFKLEDNWVDAGWCWLGHGENAIKLRFFIDLGATCTCSMVHLYVDVAKKAKDGKLGAARVATEVSPVPAQLADGSDTELKKWLQLCVKAENVAGTAVTVYGQYVSFSREGDENILVAGKDLARCLGYETPEDQRQRVRSGGVAPSQVFNAKVDPRTYVLSDETKAKIAENRKRAEQHAVVMAEGLAYVGSDAFDKVELTTEFVKEPLLRHTYITTRVVNSAGVDACKPIDENCVSEFSLGHQSAIAEWLGDGKQHCNVDEVTKTT